MSEEETNLRITFEFTNEKDYNEFMEELIKEALKKGTLKEKSANEFMVLNLNDDEI